MLLLNNLEGLYNENNNNNNKCLIHSKKYTYEFFVIDSNGENIYSRPFEMAGNFSNVIWWLIPVVDENSKTSSNKDNDNNENPSFIKTYYIKNYQTGDYVCGSNRFQIMFMTRFKAFRTNNRMLDVVSVNNENDFVRGNKMCQWKFEKTTKISNFLINLVKSWKNKMIHGDNGRAKNEFLISNVKTNEKLFTALDTLKYGQPRRHVYLMPSKKIDSLWSNDQFKWIVDCGLPDLTY